MNIYYIELVKLDAFIFYQNSERILDCHTRMRGHFVKVSVNLFICYISIFTLCTISLKTHQASDEAR